MLRCGDSLSKLKLSVLMVSSMSACYMLSRCLFLTLFALIHCFVGVNQRFNSSLFSGSILTNFSEFLTKLLTLHGVQNAIF